MSCCWRIQQLNGTRIYWALLRSTYSMELKWTFVNLKQLLMFSNKNINNFTEIPRCPSYFETLLLLFEKHWCRWLSPFWNTVQGGRCIVHFHTPHPRTYSNRQSAWKQREVTGKLIIKQILKISYLFFDKVDDSFNKFHRWFWTVLDITRC